MFAVLHHLGLDLALCIYSQKCFSPSSIRTPIFSPNLKLARTSLSAYLPLTSAFSHASSSLADISSLHYSDITLPTCLRPIPCCCSSLLASPPHNYLAHTPSTLAMAAVIAHQHIGLWQRQPDQAIHIPNMNMSALISSYEASRAVTNPPTSRAFHATSAHMDMNMPLFSAQSMATSVPYQSGAFAFDSMSANAYNLQQPFPVSYPTGLPHAVNYPGTTDMAQIPTMRDARPRFPMEKHTPPVKVEASSPVQSNQLYIDGSCNVDCKPSSPESSLGNNTNFSTHVDTLMKAIQSKQKPAPEQRPSPPKVWHPRYHNAVPAVNSPSRQEEEVEDEGKSKQKPTKKYECTIPDCRKRFYQKTHLAIHIRSHTGDKPFVSPLLFGLPLPDKS